MEQKTSYLNGVCLVPLKGAKIWVALKQFLRGAATF